MLLIWPRHLVIAMFTSAAVLSAVYLSGTFSAWDTRVERLITTVNSEQKGN